MNVKEARFCRKLTQMELSKKCGMSQDHLCNIERDLQNTTLKTLRKIARALDKQLVVDFVPIRRER